MPKIITPKKGEVEQRRAGEFIKTTQLVPAAMFGLVSLVLGYGAVIYLFIKKDAMPVVLDSSVLLVVGAVVGLAHGIYRGYLFRVFPDHFASKQLRREMIRSGKVRKIDAIDPIDHPGRGFVILLYFVLFGVFIWLAFVYSAKLNTVAALFLPLAGFFNARFFYWKRKFPQARR